MKIYNTMSGKKEEFIPQNPDKVKIYSCGPTVYNYFHIGNARPFVIFDVLRRYLEYIGYDVKFVQNFTDVDDKIINKANEENVSAHEIAERYIKEYFKDADGLLIKHADVHPRVTECMDDIINFIQALIDKGHAYQIGGDVYYDTTTFKDYGKLSGQKLDDLDAGARISVDERKKHPSDFALWKNKKSGEPGWMSPWGEGRPGWHIECSVMSRKYLGDTLDIHCGGQDLIFPHHENEIAQSEGFTGETFAKYWMHNGYINIDNKKMSKSLGNFFTVREISEKIDLEVVRFFLLNAHYRNPINFSKELLEAAKNALDRLYNAKEKLEFYLSKSSGALKAEEKELQAQNLRYKEQFKAAMDDDLNTADAIAAIFDLSRDINTYTDENSSREYLENSLKLFNELTGVLNIVTKNRNAGTDEKEINELIEKRAEAKKNKDYKTADEIRDQLLAKGIELKDTSRGTTWTMKN